MGVGGAIVEVPRSSSGCALWKRGGCVMRGQTGRLDNRRLRAIWRAAGESRRS